MKSLQTHRAFCVVAFFCAVFIKPIATFAGTNEPEPSPTVNCDAPGADLQGKLDRASVGAKIWVTGHCSDGPYFIKHDLQLSGFATATLSARPGSGNVLQIFGASLTISGIEIDATGTDYGMYIEGSSVSTIDVTVKNSPGSGIFAVGSSRVNVDRCRLIRNSIGVYVLGSSSAVITNSFVESSDKFGIIVYNNSDAFIRDTSILNGNGPGLWADRLSQFTLVTSVVDGNSGPGVFLDSKYSVATLDVGGNTIQNNNPDLKCLARAILDVAAPASSSTKTSVIDGACIVNGGPIFAP